MFETEYFIHNVPDIAIEDILTRPTDQEKNKEEKVIHHKRENLNRAYSRKAALSH